MRARLERRSLFEPTQRLLRLPRIIVSQAPVYQQIIIGLLQPGSLRVELHGIVVSPRRVIGVRELEMSASIVRSLACRVFPEGDIAGPDLIAIPGHDRQ